ncbi:MAG TPA: M48 family metallopeptidase [Planctomycetaceae bacterium]|nr:M48 family metallopeptidase [Planctomycetaceae bacterium]
MVSRVVGVVIVTLAISLPLSGSVLAQSEPSKSPDAASAPAAATASTAPRLDPVAATEAYVAKLTPEQVAKSDDYFEGGYWLQLWNFFLSSALSLILLTTRISARMRDLAERVVKFRWAQTLVYGAQYFLFTTVLSFPLAVYQGFFRERKYGLVNQTLGAWLGEQCIAIAVGAVIGAVAIMVLYAILRRVQKSWWIWASVAFVALLFVLVALAPVYIAPLFNTYKTLEDPKIRDAILSLARANEIPADNVYVFDASKQSKKVSANVSGALGTMRISLNDNLLNRCSPASVKAVMAHEMGHYVLNHVYKGLIEMGLVMTVGFAFVAWAFDRIVARRGAAWGIRSIADPAGLPLIVLLLGAYLFVMTPVTNTITRTEETEADAFGLNAAGEPDGFADAALMLSEYRKMRPGKWEEIVFYDHPSGYNRVLMAMTWKAEHPAAGAH